MRLAPQLGLGDGSHVPGDLEEAEPQLFQDLLQQLLGDPGHVIGERRGKMSCGAQNALPLLREMFRPMPISCRTSRILLRALAVQQCHLIWDPLITSNYHFGGMAL